MGNKIPPYLLQPVNIQNNLVRTEKSKLSFLDNTIINSAGAIKSIYLQAENAAKENLIQKINPHAKLILMIFMVIVISIVNIPMKQLIITAFVLLIYFIARLKIFEVYRKIFIISFIFGFLVVLPATLNVITPGKIIFNLISFDKPSQFWIYTIPENIGFTVNGFQVVSLVFLRVLILFHWLC